MTQKNTIDAIIIAKNEQERIGECLKRLSFVDHVYVIDNASTDNTAKIASKHGAIVIVSDVTSFSTLRDIGAKSSSADWLLYIDADEYITPDLQQEIVYKCEDSQSSIKAYRILRDNYYLGCKWPIHDGMIRLISKKSLISWNGDLHEHAEIDGKTDVLDYHLIHDTHRTLDEMTKKTNQWSDMEAKLRIDAHHPPVVSWRLSRVMLTGFFRSYISEKGITVGIVGVIESMFQAFSMFITYVKLWEKQRMMLDHRS